MGMVNIKLLSISHSINLVLLPHSYPTQKWEQCLETHCCSCFCCCCSPLLLSQGSATHKTRKCCFKSRRNSTTLTFLHPGTPKQLAATGIASNATSKHTASRPSSYPPLSQTPLS